MDAQKPRGGLLERAGRMLDAALSSTLWHPQAAQAPAEQRPRTGAAVPISADTRWLVRQIAWNEADPVLANPDPHMADQRPANWHYSPGFGLFEEMLDGDARVLGLTKQRQLAVLEHCPGGLRSREPGNTRADELHAFGAAVLAGIPAPRLGSAHGELWFGQFYGFTSLAPDWQARTLRFRLPGSGREKTIPDCFRAVDLLSRQRGLFNVTAAGRVMVKQHAGDPGGVELHPKAILWHTPRQRYEGPYGVPLARVLWRYAFMKKHCLKFRIIDIERYGSPFVILTYTDATAKEKLSYQEALAMIQQGVALLIPEGLKYELSNQIKGTAGTSPHESFINLCNEEMAIAILGETLTASQGEKGTQALGTVHLNVRDSAIQSDADKIAGAIQQLIDWHVELTYGPDWVELSPLYEINTRHEGPAGWLRDIALPAQKAGFPLALSQVAKKTGLTPAEDEADLLAPAQQPAPGLELLPGLAATRAALPLNARRALRAQAARAAHAGQEPRLPAAVEQLRTQGVAAQIEIMKNVPDAVLAWVNEQFDALGAGPETDVTGAAYRLPWDSLTLPAATRDAFVEQLNNDHTTAQILGREAVLAAADQAALASRNQRYPGARASLTDDPPTNPLVQALFGKQRIIPREMLSLLNRKVRASVTDEVFYRLDALARGAAFTAWDLNEQDIRHIGGALQDAGNWGLTRQQFADYLFEHLKPRYLSDGGELHAWHVETIYDTNLAAAYNQAQADAASELADTFPYTQFVNPDPQHPACTERAGQVYRTDSAFLRESTPPLHFGCGSFLRVLTERQVREAGYTVETSMPQTKPDVYAGPRDSHGRPIGTPAPFGAWAPVAERYAHLEQELKRLGVTP